MVNNTLHLSVMTHIKSCMGNVSQRNTSPFSYLKQRFGDLNR
jgi:hypothetical protein